MAVNVRASPVITTAQPACCQWHALTHIMSDTSTRPPSGRKRLACCHVQDDSKRVISFVNQSDYISFRHHTYEMPRGVKSVALTECGPRFELKIYQIRLGTLDQPHAENEWVLRAYTRSAKKAKLSEEAEEDVV